MHEQAERQSQRRLQKCRGERTCRPENAPGPKAGPGRSEIAGTVILGHAERTFNLAPGQFHCGGKLKLSLIGAALVLSVCGTLPDMARADACAHSFQLRLDTQGPWPAQGRTKRDTPCRMWFLSRSASVVYKRLYRVEDAQHGTVGLQQGGYFTYTPLRGYVGPDRFVLRVCGTVGGKDGCTNSVWDMTVVP